VSDSPPCLVCCASSSYWTTIASYRHFRCPDCGLVFVMPRPSHDEIEKVYAGGDFYDKAETERVRLEREARQRVTLLDSLADRFSLEKRVLDIGSASGVFLSAAEKREWTVRGLERSEALGRRCPQFEKGRITFGILEDVQIPGSPFPIVTAWEVLEHSIEPIRFFEAAVRHVQPGGLLAISTPLPDGIPARLLGAKFPMFCPPEHLTLFTRRSLAGLARKFSLSEIDYRSFSNLGIRSLGSGLSRILFRTELAALPAPARIIALAAGTALAWAPALVDAAGLGSEMQMVFRRERA